MMQTHVTDKDQNVAQFQEAFDHKHGTPAQPKGLGAISDPKTVSGPYGTSGHPKQALNKIEQTQTI